MISGRILAKSISRSTLQIVTLWAPLVWVDLWLDSRQISIFLTLPAFKAFRLILVRLPRPSETPSFRKTHSLPSPPFHHSL